MLTKAAAALIQFADECALNTVSRHGTLMMSWSPLINAMMCSAAVWYGLHSEKTQLL